MHVKRPCDLALNGEKAASSQSRCSVVSCVDERPDCRLTRTDRHLGASVLLDSDLCRCEAGHAARRAEGEAFAMAAPQSKTSTRARAGALAATGLIASSAADAIQQPQSTLVTSGIRRVEPKGVRTADGELHELDVLVLATGFEVDAFMRPMNIVGRGGVCLDDVWDPRPSAYMSISVPDFPNFFMLNGPNGPVGNFSLIDVAERQFAYILQLVALLRDGQCREVAATRAALDAFEQDRVEATQSTVWVTGCRSWYLDDRGVPAVWPWPMSKFRDAMSAPDLSAYELA